MSSYQLNYVAELLN